MAGDRLKNAKANRLDRRKDVNKLFLPSFCRQIGPISPTRSNAHRRKNKRKNRKYRGLKKRARKTRSFPSAFSLEIMKRSTQNDRKVCKLGGAQPHTRLTANTLVYQTMTTRTDNDIDIAAKLGKVHEEANPPDGRSGSKLRSILLGTLEKLCSRANLVREEGPSFSLAR